MKVTARLTKNVHTIFQCLGRRLSAQRACRLGPCQICYYCMLSCCINANHATLSPMASVISTFTPGPMVEVKTIFLMN